MRRLDGRTQLAEPCRSTRMGSPSGGLRASLELRRKRPRYLSQAHWQRHPGPRLRQRQSADGCPAAVIPATGVSGVPVSVSAVNEPAFGATVSVLLLATAIFPPPFAAEAYAPGMLRVPTRYRRHSGLARGWQGTAVCRRALPTARGSGRLPCCACALSSSAAAPDTIGVAKLLPVKDAVPPSGAAPSIFSPGARIPLDL